MPVPADDSTSKSERDRGDARGRAFDPQDIWQPAFEYYARLGRVKRFVELHYAEPITLDAAAAVARLERTYFSAYFHTRTGVCYRDWVSWMRVRQALRLMHETDVRLTQICFAVGFRDLRTFERAFVRCTGQSPSLARRGAATG